MRALRYVALLALVVWISRLIDGLFDDILRPFHVVAIGCGGVILVCLLAMKFIGPPPIAFPTRLALVLLMLVLAVGSGMLAPALTTMILTADLAIGLVLLGWYVRE